MLPIAIKQVVIDETNQSEASTSEVTPRQTPLSLVSADPYQDIEDFLFHETEDANIDSIVYSRKPTFAKPSLKPSLKISTENLCIDSPIQNDIFVESPIQISYHHDDRWRRHGKLPDASLFNALALDVPSPSRV